MPVGQRGWRRRLEGQQEAEGLGSMFKCLWHLWQRTCNGFLSKCRQRRCKFARELFCPQADRRLLPPPAASRLPCWQHAEPRCGFIFTQARASGQSMSAFMKAKHLVGSCEPTLIHFRKQKRLGAGAGGGGAGRGRLMQTDLALSGLWSGARVPGVCCPTLGWRPVM